MAAPQTPFLLLSQKQRMGFLTPSPPSTLFEVSFVGGQTKVVAFALVLGLYPERKRWASVFFILKPGNEKW